MAECTQQGPDSSKEGLRYEPVEGKTLTAREALPQAEPAVERVRRELEKHRRIGAAWREMAVQYMAIIDAFDGLIYICSQDYEVEFMNQKCIDRTGHYPLGQKCFKALHDLEEICPWCVNDRVFRGEKVTWEMQSPKDRRWYSIVNTPIRYSDGTLHKMALIRDITARKEIEERLRRTTRALTIMGAGGRVLLRAREERELVQEICRIIVAAGGYRLAWVGRAERDAQKSVRPLGSAGFEAGYLERVRISWGDSDTGRGPTGTAIRTGRPCICRNLLTDPQFAPWREEARRRGYASSIALPLQEDDRTWGALNIYAAEPEAFDAAEVALLTQLAEDLAYGIANLRLRKEREGA